MKIRLQSALMARGQRQRLRPDRCAFRRTEEWDYYMLRETISGDEAFRPKDSVRPLVRKG